MALEERKSDAPRYCLVPLVRFGVKLENYCDISYLRNLITHLLDRRMLALVRFQT